METKYLLITILCILGYIAISYIAYIVFTTPPRSRPRVPRMKNPPPPPKKEKWDEGHIDTGPLAPPKKLPRFIQKDFLHSHPSLEKRLIIEEHLPKDHIIVDREDWEEFHKYINK